MSLEQNMQVSTATLQAVTTKHKSHWQSQWRYLPTHVLTVPLKSKLPPLASRLARRDSRLARRDSRLERRESRLERRESRLARTNEAYILE